MKLSYRFYYNSYPLRLREGEAITHLPALHGYKEGDSLTVAFESEIEVAEGLGDVEICEVLFSVFNDLWSRPDEYRGPSMSVGDIVTLANIRNYACSQFGFRDVNISKSIITQCPHEWRRTGSALEKHQIRKKAEMERNIA